MAEEAILAAYPKTVTAAEFAAFIVMNDRGVRDLIKEKVVTRDKSRRVLLIPSIKAYINRLRNRAAGRGEGGDGKTLAATRSTLTDLQSEEARLRIARAKGELIAIQDVADSWADIAQIVRSEGLALASRIAFVVPHMTAHDRIAVAKVCREMLTNIAEQIEGAAVPGSHGGQEFVEALPPMKPKLVEVALKSNRGRPRKS